MTALVANTITGALNYLGVELKHFTDPQKPKEERAQAKTSTPELAPV